jgi:inosine-uridine nucleoside N-ribohydrolase
MILQAVLITISTLFYLTQASKVKMIIDTDGVADDVRALTMALQHPNVNLMAITTVTGSTSAPQAVANVARTLRANKITKDVRD